MNRRIKKAMITCVLFLFSLALLSAQVYLEPGQVTTIQAEDASLGQAEIESDHPGHTGSGYVNFANEPGSYLEWIVEVSSDGPANCEFVFANGGNDRPMDIAVNGSVVTSNPFPNTGGWPNWISAGADINLSAGNNTIRLTSTSSEGGPNMDRMEITFNGNGGPSGTTGDVNDDKMIDIVDALLVAQFYVNLDPTPFDESVADVNCDLSIDIVDALLIAQYYVDLIDAFETCGTPTPVNTPTPEITQTPISSPEPTAGPNNGLPRVIVTTDIGGTDPDDYQSMAHYLVYADAFQTEGLISSPHSTGRKDAILKAIDAYEDDYPNLRTYSENYPEPDALRAITKNGAPGSVSGGGGQVLGEPSEGSQLIIQAASRPDPRPLFILVWGSIGDVAQAVHDAPEIKEKIRVYFIGGPNKKGCADTYNYLEVNHKDLWIIETNSTYRGFFNGGYMSGDYGNSSFVSTNVRGHGALGDYLYDHRSELKMGDTPSVYYVYNNNLDDPTQEGWGGSFVRAWQRSHLIETQVKTGGVIERFGIYELQIPVGNVSDPWAKISVANQNRPGIIVDGIMQLRCSSKNAEKLSYSTTSNIPALAGKSGSFTAQKIPADRANNPSSDYANWWTDNTDPSLEEGGEQGAKTVNKWRKDYLDDFAARMDRAKSPKQ